jgi:5-methylcytosine-specific restriction protein A
MAYNRAETIRAGTGAAQRLRQRIRADLRRDIWPSCARCLRQALPSAMDIDHITPLFKGGQDVDENVQVLCRLCHRTKTNEDMGSSVPPF